MRVLRINEVCFIVKVRVRVRGNPTSDVMFNFKTNKRIGYADKYFVLHTVHLVFIKHHFCY